MPWLIAVVIGGLAFVSVLPVQALDPRSLSWAMQDDSATQVLGWRFFCAADWALPLGRTPGYLTPTGTTLLLTDSMPIVAVALRGLGLCGAPPFQYLGPFIFVCFVVQGVGALRLSRALHLDVFPGLVLVVMCCTSPILIWRTHHATLCAQWVLLFAFEAMVMAPRRPAGTTIAVGCGLAGFLSLLHPYLLVMTLPFLLVAMWSGPSRRVEGSALIVVVGVVGLWVTGAIGDNEPIMGFGVFQADLLGFFDARDKGRLLPSTNSVSTEALTYLGAGIIGGVGVGAWQQARATREGAERPAAIPGMPGLGWLVAVGLWVFSLSTTIVVLGRPVVDVDITDTVLAPILSALRASGRMAWPLWYLLAVVAVVAVARLPRARWWLIGLLCLQVVDIIPAGPQPVSPAEFSFADEARWRGLVAGQQRLALEPPIIANSPLAALANAWPDPTVYIRFAWLAADEGLAINSGYSARPQNNRLRVAAEAQIDALNRGVAEAGVVYVFPPALEAPFAQDFLCCQRLVDGTACVARSTARIPCEGPR